MVLLLFAWFSPTWVKGGVTYNQSLQSSALGEQVCPNPAIPLFSSGKTPLDATKRVMTYHFGITQYKTAYQTYFSDGEVRFATCYYPVDQAVGYWNSEIDENPGLVSGQHIEKGDLDSAAVLLGFAALVQVWMTLAVWRFSHGKEIFPSEEAGDQWFLSYIGGGLRRVFMCCPSGSEAGISRSMWAHVAFQIAGWLCAIASLSVFAAGRVMYLVCQITDPDRTVYCGHGVAWNCAVSATVLLLFNAILIIMVARPAENDGSVSTHRSGASGESSGLLGGASASTTKSTTATTATTAWSTAATPSSTPAPSTTAASSSGGEGYHSL